MNVELILTTTVCNACGVTFAVPDSFMENLKKSGQTFYCPNGHSLFFGKSEADKLRDKLRETEREAKLNRQWYEAEMSDHEHTRRKLSATKGQLTKTKKRVANGVCPCCNRHFVNLEQHMKGKHPDYDTQNQTDK